MPVLSTYRDDHAPAKPRHAPESVPANPVLGVFGLSVRTRERDIEDEFSRYGDVEKVVIVYDQRVCSG
jgi:transformer-2 protein